MISQRLVELALGTIDISSEVGVGSRFWIRVLFEWAEGPGITLNQRQFDKLAKRRVLIVSDHSNLSISLQYALREVPVEVDVVFVGPLGLSDLEGIFEALLRKRVCSRTL